MIATVLSALASGDSVEDVLEDYPAITKQNIQAIFDFASKMATFNPVYAIDVRSEGLDGSNEFLRSLKPEHFPS